jgi:two-component system, NarL family, nitrate/nitrite response regulator NarL
MTIRVMLLDDHPSLLDTLQNLLRDADDITVVARGNSGREAIATVLDRQADAIVLDLRLPVMDGLELLRTIDDKRLGVRVILLTGAVGDTDIPVEMRLGVSPVVGGEIAPSQLLSHLRTVLTDQQWRGRRSMEPDGEGGKRGPGDRTTASPGLTARELDIARAIASGLRNRAIAEKLRVTEGTVKVHLHNIYKKLGLDSRLALMVYTKEHGLV